jgi:hypothetical protein
MSFCVRPCRNIVLYKERVHAGLENDIWKRAFIDYAMSHSCMYGEDEDEQQRELEVRNVSYYL